MKKGYITRNLPPRVFTELDDESEIFNLVITSQGASSSSANQSSNPKDELTADNRDNPCIDADNTNSAQ